MRKKKKNPQNTEEPVQTEQTSQEKTKGVVLFRYEFILADARSDADILGVCMKDSPVEILETSDDKAWYKVQLTANNKTGWMRKVAISIC